MRAGYDEKELLDAGCPPDAVRKAKSAQKSKFYRDRVNSWSTHCHEYANSDRTLGSYAEEAA